MASFQVFPFGTTRLPRSDGGRIALRQYLLGGVGNAGHLQEHHDQVRPRQPAHEQLGRHSKQKSQIKGRLIHLGQPETDQPEI